LSWPGPSLPAWAHERPACRLDSVRLTSLDFSNSFFHLNFPKTSVTSKIRSKLYKNHKNTK
jgi:hypothetical protein